MPNPQLLRVPLSDAADDAEPASVLVEVETATSGIVRAARPGEVAATAVRSLSETFDQVRAAAEAALGRVTALTTRPKKVELELGVKFSAEAGAVIARTAAEGNVVLRLVWENPGTEPGRPAPEASADAGAAPPDAG
ncbi:CU044_2847 family protein [Streptomyces sp. NPDC001851]|uniref:CU044_2847 family protein n=1 Tax=Streptomyces sp. NPDC001851 TaxID=3154529 RepID=UPI00332E7E4B